MAAAPGPAARGAAKRRERALQVAARLDDLVSTYGHGDVDRGVATVAQFVENTLVQEQFKRSWSSTSVELSKNIESSIKNILGLRPGATRSAHTWVLDIFEATADRVSGRQRFPAVAKSRAVARAASLGERILAAYIRRDEDVILELAEAADALEIVARG